MRAGSCIVAARLVIVVVREASLSIVPLPVTYLCERAARVEGIRIKPLPVYLDDLSFLTYLPGREESSFYLS